MAETVDEPSAPNVAGHENAPNEPMLSAVGNLKDRRVDEVTDYGPRTT
jgi:hypothetical protein